MLYTEDFSMHHYDGFSQIRSHMNYVCILSSCIYHSVLSLHLRIVTSAMTGTSSDRTHHMERPATVAGFRPSITSQVEVSKSVEEWSDLTHGEYKQYSVCSELCMY